MIGFPVKAAGVLVSAALLVPFVADWTAPGAGCRAAFDVLTGGPSPIAAYRFSLWGWLVRQVGWNVEALGFVSLAGALACAALVGQVVGDVFAFAIRRARENGVELEGREEFAGLRGVAVMIAMFAFVLTPAFMREATRTGPLLVWMAQPLAVVALGVRLVSDDAPDPIGGLRRQWPLTAAAALVFAHSAYEAYLIRRALVEAWTGFVTFAAVGVAPCLYLAGLVRFRLLLVERRRVQCVVFGVWALAVAVTGVVAFRTVGRGRTASRLVEAVLENAAGRRALVCDGEMEPLFAFALGGTEACPRLVSFAHEHDPAYGRRLAEWVRDVSRSRGARADGGGEDSADRVEDLVFAAELGACVLIDEWLKVDPADFEAQVASYGNFFPTAAKWRSACAICEAATDDPFGGVLRRFLGVTGNALGCKMLEREDRSGEREAWEIFREITERVDPENGTALLNRLGMIDRGYGVSPEEADEIRRRCAETAKRLGTRERVLTAVARGGRLYVDPGTAARLERERVARMRARRLSPREEALVAAATRPPGSLEACRDARATLAAAVKDGMVRVDYIGNCLVNLDFAVGEWGFAEYDAISVLRVDRRHTAANAAMSVINRARGDYERAEKYLARAIRSDAHPSGAALNDLAFTLARTGRATEAVPLARAAVEGRPGDWNFRETLAYALIRAGETERGEEELAKAEALAEAAGRKKDGIVRFALDRAWLHRMRGDWNGRSEAVRALRLRKDLTDGHRRELDEVEDI